MTDLTIGPALYHAYEEGSVTGVVEWVEKNHPEWDRAYCVPCEEETYTWPKAQGGEDCCAVCWTTRNP